MHSEKAAHLVLVRNNRWFLAVVERAFL